MVEKRGFLQGVRDFIGTVAFVIFLWAIRMSEEEYFADMSNNYEDYIKRHYQ